jgi:pyruvate,water dikinase
VQQLTVDTALELGKRLVRHGTLDDPSDVRWFRFEELVAHLDDPTAADVAPAPPPEVPALPERFRLSDSGEVVADRSGSDGGPTGVSPGRASGTVAHEPGTPDRPVLVVGSLDPTLATELPNVAAIVSETGSPLSHLAILAREQHVPVVVGVPDATSAHPVGQHVIVDGDAGTIEPDEQVPAEEGERSRS